MIAPLDITIGSLTFQSLGLSPLDVLRLDKTVIGLVAPAMSGLSKDANGKLNIDFGKSAAGIGDLLVALPDNVVTDFLCKVFKRVTWVSPTEGALPLNNEATINKAFADSPVTDIYKLLGMVLKHNKFSFFVLADSGAGILKTLGLGGLTPSGSENGAPSATSEPSIPS